MCFPFHLVHCRLLTCKKHDPSCVDFDFRSLDVELQRHGCVVGSFSDTVGPVEPVQNPLFNLPDTRPQKSRSEEWNSVK